MLSGCGLYNKYEKTVQEPADVFGSTLDIPTAVSETSIADLSWREFFTDPLLQQLIEQALANNTDLNTARINVEKSEISLKTSVNWLSCRRSSSLRRARSASSAASRGRRAIPFR